MQITTVGLSLAKSVFQVHAVDASEGVVVRRTLRRSQVLPFFAWIDCVLCCIDVADVAVVGASVPKVELPWQSNARI